MVAHDTYMYIHENVQLRNTEYKRSVIALLATRRDLAEGTRTRQVCGLGIDFAHKIGCHGNAPWVIEKLTTDRSSTCIVLPEM